MAIYRIKRFSETRESVPEDIMSKVRSGGGVIQKDHDGVWRIINKRKGVFWNAHYDSRSNAEAALRGY